MRLNAAWKLNAACYPEGGAWGTLTVGLGHIFRLEVTPLGNEIWSYDPTRNGTDYELLGVSDIPVRVRTTLRDALRGILDKTPVIVVTRHPALVDLLIERGIVARGTPVLEHVDDPGVLDGAHVIGVLPLHLACHAVKVTEIPLAMTPADRGHELDLPRLREIAGEAVTYTVRRCEL